MRRLRAIFFGSADFAVPMLCALASAHDVHAVYTQPDRPSGRGLKPSPTPVKRAAESLGLDVFTPELLDSAFVSLVSGLHPELLACAAYGRILPAEVLETASLGALNAHPSLLPRYRGATPIQAALREGLTQTGVSIIWMSKQMDAGDIALARAVTIEGSDDFGSLHDRLARVAAELALEAAGLLAAGTLPRAPQDDAQATYVKPLQKADLRIDFGQSARAVVDQVRSLSPKPGAWMEFEGARLKVLAARAEPARAGAEPETLASANGDGPLVAAADGAVRLLRVVPSGRSPMSGAEFMRGR